MWKGHLFQSLGASTQKVYSNVIEVCMIQLVLVYPVTYIVSALFKFIKGAKVIYYIFN